MLIRVTGPGFVAGLVFEEDGRIRKAAPIVRWAMGMTVQELRAEIARRGLKAAYVRTLTRPELTGQAPRVIGPGDVIEVDDD